MQDQAHDTPDPISSLLMRRGAERLGMPARCPTRACRRKQGCGGAGSTASELSCGRAANAMDRARFDRLVTAIEAIRNGTLWPEPARDAELRAMEAVAINLIRKALPSMPEFKQQFEDWLKRYRRPPTYLRTHAWLKYARGVIAGGENEAD